MDLKRYTYDISGFILWWNEIVHGRKITDNEFNKILENFNNYSNERAF